MSDLISIIVPIYNVEKYLSRCIESIILQTYENIEIILVDDGSTDSSGNICEAYKRKDSRIHIVHKNNGGLVSARKAGLKVARGIYVGFVDGDDYIELNMYQRLYELITSAEVDFIHGGYLKNDETLVGGTSKNQIINLTSGDSRIKVAHDLIFDLKNNQKMSPCLCFKLFKYDLIKEAYMKVPDCQSYGEDLVALCRLLFISNSMMITEEGYYHYIVRNESIMNLISKKKMLRENELRACLIGLMREYAQNEQEYVLLEEDVNTYWLAGIMDDIKRMFPEVIRVFNCDFIEKLKGHKIILYGAGNVGKDYYSQIKLHDDILLVKWVDKNADDIVNTYHSISAVEDIMVVDFDYIIVAVLDQGQAEYITKEIINMGINKNKILWKKPVLSSTLS